MAYGKTIELFLVNGTADSLIKAEISNWNGIALKIPRLEIKKCDRDEITRAGVYFLFCKEDDGSDSVYIGETENVKERLIQHMRDYDSEKESFYWNTAVVFVGRDLNKALIRYLEYRFVEIAQNCKRYHVLTKNTCKNICIKESQIAVMEEFIDNAKVLINTLGYKVLEPLLKTAEDIIPEEETFSIKMGKAYALGRRTSEGFVVLKGATVNEKTSIKTKGMKELRVKLLKEKVNDLVTTEDILLTSPTAAAEFVLGYDISGPATWKTKDGRTLKEIEEKA